MANQQKYDAIVIGASTAAVSRLCPVLAQAGWKTALIEREHVEGTCVNVGCMPTKTMVASARVAYLARRAADYGVSTAPVTVDMARVRQRKQDVVSGFRGFDEGLIEKAEGVDLFRGEASFTGPKSVDVRLNDGGIQQLTADTIVIDTGARPRRPSIPGLESVSTLDSTSIMELDTLPEHLLILGGGYIGVEFSQMFRRFGSRVTMIQSGQQLLAREDPDVAEEVTNILPGRRHRPVTESQYHQGRTNHRWPDPIDCQHLGERGTYAHRLTFADGHRPGAQHRAAQSEGSGDQDRRERRYPGQRAAGNQRSRCLRHR